MDYMMLSTEYLFRYTYPISKFFSDSYTVWLLFTSSLIFIPLYFVLKKYSVNPLYSIFLYITYYPFPFLESFNIMRQSIAFPWVLWTICLWNDNKRIMSFITLLIASMFHISSWMVLPLLVLSRLNIHNKVIVVASILCFVIGLFGGVNANLLIPFLNTEEGLIIQKIVRYSNVGNSTIIGYLFNTFPLLIICLLLLPKKNVNNSMYNLLFYSFILLALFSVSFSIIIRVVFCVVSVLLIFIPLVYEKSTRVFTQRFLILDFCMLIIYVLYVFFMDRHLIPFETSL